MSAGNTAGDATVTVDVGTLAAGGGTVTIVFEVIIDDPLPGNITQILNSGVITGANFAPAETDDPSLPGSSDATAVQIVPTNIPTLNTWMLLLLMTMLGLVAVRRISAA